MLRVTLGVAGMVVLMNDRAARASEPELKSPTERYANHLIHEKSPYLLQHARNPVDWYPWGPEAFEKAKRENKPIFLSIGYSTCHWCHVMEREDFEDAEVARLMNQTFVSIKVDREERPDLDQVYMTVCQMLTGSGGWPLTILMTPDKKPFFAATYLPKEGRFGQMGMMQLVPYIHQFWETQHEKIMGSANEIVAALGKLSPEAGGKDLGEASLKLAYQQLVSQFDAKEGGFGGAPKFPTAQNLTFLLRYGKRSGDARALEPHALEMVETTLQAMRRGGIYDHVGFGFHRYSTDAEWRVPHFEKMLYDQATLALAYTEAYQATRKEEYAATAREIFTYVLRDMTAPGGGFYSAEDADSEGQEGKFYLWTEDEVRRVLPASDAELIVRSYNVTREGNFQDPHATHPTGDNILHRTKSLHELAAESKISEAELAARLDAAREKLFAARERRIHPFKDDKILTDWNGLMIAAFAVASQALDESGYAQAAQRASDFILRDLRAPEGRLFHSYRDGQASVVGNLDDYAFLTWGLIELYEATFDVRDLKTALALTRVMREHFSDQRGGGYFFTADDAEQLLVRQKEIYDGALPSGNSVQMLNLLRLARLTGDTDFEQQAAGIGRAFAKQVGRAPSGFGQLMAAVDFAVGPSYEVVIAGDSRAADTQAMLRALRDPFIPCKVVLLRPSEQASPEITRLAEYTQGQSSLDGKATAYVCQNFRCQLPTTDVRQMLESLRVKPLPTGAGRTGH
ncbi:MAG TPA: thioredoxin domain-containing protein [Terriglobia bacterium]|nr:thioredoxin domain-containing protein [Terriglobia bacterium]